MIGKIVLTATLTICSLATTLAQTGDKKLIFISNSHLDTQWNWTAKTTINEYILNTMVQNFQLFDKYPDFNLNFEGAIHYMWMKEYYPAEYAKLKQYIANGQWNISGGSINANEVMVSSAESIIRNFLYGQTYYKKEFGKKGGSDIMLPDCFGFPYSLPTLGKHCGAIGFHTQKLTWGCAYDHNTLPPFGIWKGVDGSEIYAIFKGEAYDAHTQYNKDMSNDENIRKVIDENQLKYGVSAAIRYVGPMSDRGGGLQDNANSKDERTPYWLQHSIDSDGPVKVDLWSPDAVFQYLAEHRNENYVVWDNELPMQTHGTGCYTSQTMMKYWNRKNELLADAAEKASTAASWTGGATYPSENFTENWTRILWHQFHDDLTGTSVPGAYTISHNDEVITNKSLASTLTNAVGAVSRQLDTQVEGIPLVVYNPLSQQRTDIVKASVQTSSKPQNIRVHNATGKEVLAQITDFDANTGTLSFLFKATVPPLGFEVYELRVNEASTLTSALQITTGKLENEHFTIMIDQQTGDVKQVRDKINDKNLLRSPIQMVMLNNYSGGFPSWEITHSTVNETPSYVDENVKISVAEEGPLRVSLKVERTKGDSRFVQYIRLMNSEVSDRIDFENEVDWQSRGKLLKVAFPFQNVTSKATYDLSIGAIERGNNKPNLYEVAGHQWADVTATDESYGVSILNDCKYGWDKPNDFTLRLTLIHTPSVGGSYVYQQDQDLGLNTFTYSLYGHTNKWDERTQWEASRLNQPLLAFEPTKHTGTMGKNFSFASLNTEKVSVKALKKAEETDETIIRLYELTGVDQTNVEVSFPTTIISAREVNGIEEAIGTASFDENKLQFDIGKFSPKTFAVKLASPELKNAITPPSSNMIDLNYTIDLMSDDNTKSDLTTSTTHGYPSELLSDILVADGIKFKIGPRENRKRNALRCNAVTPITIALSKVHNAKKVYILAASNKEEGTTAQFTIAGKTTSFHVPYWSETVGERKTEYNLGSKFCKEDIAFTATHRHTKTGKNENSIPMHMYKYAIPVNADASELEVAPNSNLCIFAITVSDNENDNLLPASEVVLFPTYKDLEERRECGERLIPSNQEASNQNGSNEGADKAVDNDLTTKWCATNNPSPWLELSFPKLKEICGWSIINAGDEDAKYITIACRLQRFENGEWIDVDKVENNKFNKVNRSISTPFTTDRVRLQIDKGALEDNTTRILEFSVYGKDADIVGIEQPTSGSIDFNIKANYPNPFTQRTTISCTVPESTSELMLHVYDCVGRCVDKRAYTIAGGGDQELEWEHSSMAEGIYLYVISIVKEGHILFSNTKKMTLKG